MTWRMLLYLPSLVSLVWAVVIMLGRRRISWGQVFFSIAMLMEAFAMWVLLIFLWSKAGSLFIYDYIFKLVSIFCPAMFFLGTCAMVEARGTTLRQRRVLLVPILYIAGLTVGAFLVGPRRYEEICNLVKQGGACFVFNDALYNFFIVWSHWLYAPLLFLYSVVLLIVGGYKAALFGKRFNSYYAAEGECIKPEQMTVVLWGILVVGMASIGMVYTRWSDCRVATIVCALLMATLQYLLGHIVYGMQYDARYTTILVRRQMEGGST